MVYWFQRPNRGRRHKEQDMSTETPTNKIKRSKTGNNPCRCIIPLHDGEWTEDGAFIMEFQVGCGATCSHEFAQGHDAKYKSELIRAFRAGATVVLLDGDFRIETDSMTLAAARGWERFITPGKPKAEKKAKAPKTSAGLQVGDAVEFKIGRWTKRGLVRHCDGPDTTVEYEDAKGNAQVAVVATDKLVAL